MKQKTLSEKTADDLIKYIRTEGLVSGEKLPNENELSSLLKVGRNTVREALRMLASRNIINIRHGSGMFVSDKKGIPEDPLGFVFAEDGNKLAADLLQIRFIIEPQIASIAAQNATAEDLISLEAAFRKLEKSLENKEKFPEADMEFHKEIAKCSHNNVMSKLIPIINAGVMIFSSDAIEKGYEQAIESHKKIFEAIKSRRSFDAHQAMLFHFHYNQDEFFNENSWKTK
jgi:DNA-binding FadR family transcriptional regulator